MTDRHAAYLVILEDDIRDDDAAGVIGALWHVKGVASVEPVVSSYEFAVARTRRDTAWRNALLALAKDGPGQEAGQ